MVLILESAEALLVIFAVIVGIALGLKENPIYLSITIAAIVFILIRTYFRKRKELEKSKIQIIEQWGKERKAERDIGEIKELYRSLLNSKEFDVDIDDITWKDLDMDLVFGKIDHTESLPGRQYLYNLLRHPVYNDDFLKKRNEVIKKLGANTDVAQKVKLPLLLLGEKGGKGMVSFLWGDIKIEKGNLLLYRALSILPILSLAIAVFNPEIGISGLILSFLANSYTHFKSKLQMVRSVSLMQYMAKLIGCAESIVKLDTGDIGLSQSKLGDLAKEVKKLYRYISKLNYNNNKIKSELDFVIDLFNMLFLRETLKYYKSIGMMEKKEQVIRELYLTVGEIDTFVALASYKSSLDYFTEPELVNYNSKFFINVEEIYHPLLEKPVSNSFEIINRGVLVTGSNASGKSTLLRTIGINAIFAQTIYTVLAKKYTSNYYRILTSIGTSDSISSGDSYFMTEAKSLKRIIDMTEKEVPILCMLDEIFRGTNTAERISAAVEVLKYLTGKNCCVIAATHDLELTRILEEYYDNYHTQEEVAGNDIKFDYKLRKGPSTSRNAIMILKLLGYPDEIYERAMTEAKDFLQKAL